MLLDFRKPQIYILDKCVSWSGKYFCFFGNHYEKGIPCWVYGSSNKESGEIVMRHYNEKLVGSLAPKAEAETEWRKFKEAMLAKPESQESEDAHIQRPWERERVKRGPKGGLKELLKRPENKRVN